ncbi:MAG TPA: glucosamine-6-phosphate deaminase [Victivallales bacterium]|nr:glucosamine-6-phosphate deaminase [Victivallales bacterium]
MDTKVYNTAVDLGVAAAEQGAKIIKSCIAVNGRANIILATGASQFEMMKHLVTIKGIDWSKVTAFHLDEYIGLHEVHPASFRKYLKERFLEKVELVNAFHFVNGTADDIEEECMRLERLISEHPIDVAFVGIGENGHLAFNDPPADFETDRAYLAVDLDKACREQQMGEGWFKSLDDVPTQAISMGIKQIMKSKNIIVSVPDERKAEAVKNTLNKEIINMFPASILRKHPNCYLYLDKGSASLL